MVTGFRKKRGVTLVEVLLVIGILSLLLALSLPAIQAARERSRITQCQFNIRSHCIAFSGYELVKRCLPASVSVTIHGPLPGGAVVNIHNYMLPLLPFVEDGIWQVDLSRDFTEQPNADIIAKQLTTSICPSTPDRSPTSFGKFSLADGAFDLALTPDNAALATLFELTAPSAEKHFNAAAGDYSVPTGVSRPVAKALNYALAAGGARLPWVVIDGLFPLPMRAAHDFSNASLANVRSGGSITLASRRRLNSVSDGTSTTLMLIEDAGRPQAWRQGFRVAEREPTSGVGWSDPSGGIIIDGIGVSLDGLIQGSNSAKPYSFHAAGVSVGFADGHASTLSETIDARLLVALITPSGGELAELPD